MSHSKRISFCCGVAPRDSGDGAVTLYLCGHCDKEKAGDCFYPRELNRGKKICKECAKKRNRDKKYVDRTANERHKRWYEQNKEKALCRIKEWKDANQDKVEEYKRNSTLRAAKKRSSIDNNIGNHSAIRYVDCCLCDKKEVRKVVTRSHDSWLCDQHKGNVLAKYKYGGLFRECTTCGLAYNSYYRKGDKSCSDECQREVVRNVNQQAKHIRRARKRNAVSEPIYRNKLFSRDKWRCVKCGIKVVRSKEYRPDRATMDHIIPISLGGSHTYSNLQTMCNSCNSEKNNQASGEQITIFCNVTN